MQVAEITNLSHNDRESTYVTKTYHSFLEKIWNTWTKQGNLCVKYACFGFYINRFMKFLHEIPKDMHLC